MADAVKCDIERAGQALVVLRHDEVVVRGADRDGGTPAAGLAEVFQPQGAGFHFAGVLADADARQLAAGMRRGDRDQALDPVAAVACQIGRQTSPPMLWAIRATRSAPVALHTSSMR